MALTKVSTGVVDMSGNTGGLVIAKGTTAQQLICNPPTTSNLGSIRENTDSGVNKVEVCTSTGWQFLEEVGPTTAPLIVDYLVIAGGGGGGAAAYNSHATIGGGGAGGYRNSYDSETSGGGGNSETALTLASNTTYNVTVGEGGDGAAYQSNQSQPGEDSVFDSITSIGGGGGASRNTNSVNKNGGSGGGGCYGKSAGSGTANQGYNGGWSGGNTLFVVGGGGGAGSLGVQGDSRNSTSLTCGGNGLSSAITGSNVVRAEGGGGSTTSSSTAFPALKVGSGGFGGNEISTGATLRKGSNGEVILRYPESYTVTKGGSLISSVSTSVAGYKIETFTSGAGTITFA